MAIDQTLRRFRRFVRLARGFGLASTLRYSLENRTALHPGLAPLHRLLARPALHELCATGRLPLPRFLSVYPTWRCNLRCAMCHQGGKEACADRSEFTVEEFASLFRGPNACYINSIRFLGGEAFLRPDFLLLCDLCDAHDVTFIITTNGTLFTEERVRKLESYANLGNIVLSLDGPPEIHNAIRRQLFAFDKLREGVELFRDRSRLSVNTVVTRENLDHLAGVIDIVHGFGIRRIGLNLEEFVTTNDLSATSGLVERWLGRPVACAGNVRDAGGSVPLELLQRRIEEAKAHAQRRGLLLSLEPRVFTGDLARYVRGDTLRGRVVCRDLSTQPHAKIDPSGQVFPCEGIPVTFGNIFTQPLPEIWNSPELCLFRREMALHLPPRCRRCCSLLPLDGREES